MWWTVAVLALPASPRFVFASFNNARSKALVDVWRRNRPAVDRPSTLQYMDARMLLTNPRTFSVVAHPVDRDGMSVLICERRPSSHVLRACLWAGSTPGLREDCICQAAAWHGTHLGNGSAFVLGTLS